MKTAFLFVLLTSVSFSGTGQVCKERLFTSYEKIVLLDIYQLSAFGGYFLGDKGAFTVRESIMPNEHILWEVTMIYDDQEMRNDPPSQYGYVANVPILFLSNREGNKEERWACLEPVLFDWLFTAPDENIQEILHDDEGFRDKKVISSGPPKSRNRFTYLVFFNKWGELMYKNYKSPLEIYMPQNDKK